MEEDDRQSFGTRNGVERRAIVDPGAPPRDRSLGGFDLVVGSGTRHRGAHRR
jgi:hypothetical protein